MAKAQKKEKPVENQQLFQPADFLDLIAPAAVKFNFTDSYVRAACTTAVSGLRDYPAVTELACSPTSATGPASPLHLCAGWREEDAITTRPSADRLDRSNQDNLRSGVSRRRPGAFRIWPHRASAPEEPEPSYTAPCS